MPIHVVRNAVALSREDTASAQRLARRHGENIFNPDKKRKQFKLRNDNPIVKYVSNVLRRRGFLYGRTTGDSVLIHSAPGCKRQQWHTDYKTSSIQHLRKKPLGVLVALMPGTSFDTPTRQYTMDTGDMIVFDGDEVHAGAAYSEENTRFHMYVESPTHFRTMDRTYFTPT